MCVASVNVFEAVCFFKSRGAEVCEILMLSRLGVRYMSGKFTTCQLRVMEGHQRGSVQIALNFQGVFDFSFLFCPVAVCQDHHRMKRTCTTGLNHNLSVAHHIYASEYFQMSETH